MLGILFDCLEKFMILIAPTTRRRSNHGRVVSRGESSSRPYDDRGDNIWSPIAIKKREEQQQQQVVFNLQLTGREDDQAPRWCGGRGGWVVTTMTNRVYPAELSSNFLPFYLLSKLESVSRSYLKKAGRSSLTATSQRGGYQAMR